MLGHIAVKGTSLSRPQRSTSSTSPSGELEEAGAELAERDRVAGADEVVATLAVPLGGEAAALEDPLNGGGDGVPRGDQADLAAQDALQQRANQG